MAIAFFPAVPNLLASLQAVFGWLAGPRPAPAPAMPVLAAMPAPQACIGLKPLRVVRVLEPSAPRSVAGRMVISGRLADVCAELDRLAALEAQGC
ncbi:MAG: hypothetical protein EOO24_17660 [Comamonadaceae bacterium]|nr:MAG: hypothetical protein EOO24_17660 [Comamonadaceae bacterium]